MSTSLLYHGFQARGYEYVSTDFIDGRIIISAKRSRVDLACPACGRKDVTMKGTVVRDLRMVPIGRKQVVLVKAYNVPLFCHGTPSQKWASEMFIGRLDHIP